MLNRLHEILSYIIHLILLIVGGPITWYISKLLVFYVPNITFYLSVFVMYTFIYNDPIFGDFG